MERGVAMESYKETRKFIPASLKNGVLAALAAPIIMFTPGTGGLYTPQNVKNIKNDRIFINVNIEKQEISQVDLSPPSEKIRIIKDNLGLNVSELASVLEVSRPTVYSWLDGNEPKPDSSIKINQLSKIAEKIHDLQIDRLHNLIRRPIFDGSKSLIDIIKNHEETADALAKLKDFADKEKIARLKQKGFSKNISAPADIAFNSPSIHYDRG